VTESETKLRRIERSEHSVNDTSTGDRGRVVTGVSLRRVGDPYGRRRYNTGGCVQEKFSARSHRTASDCMA